MGSILEASYRFSRDSQSRREIGRESLMEYLRKTKVMLAPWLPAYTGVLSHSTFETLCSCQLAYNTF